MSLVSSKKVDVNSVELIIEVKGEQWKTAVDASFKKNVKDISLPGFRRGKAPRTMVEKTYGKGVFYDDAVNALYPKAYQEAVEAAALDPVDAADIEITEVDDNGFTFTARVTTRPEVTLGKYQGVEAEKAVVAVTEADIAAALEETREKFARILTVEGRAAQNGDVATIDFEGFAGGVPFPGGKGENHPLPLGSGTFIPGFEEQIVGHTTGEEFDVNVTFPTEYGEATLAGVEAVFKIKLLELKERLLPDLDDEFAKDASEFDTLDALKADLEKKLLEQKEAEAKEAFEGALMDAVVADMTVEVPDCMYLARMDELARDFAMRLSQQGLKLEDFIRYSGDTKEKFFESFRPQAEQQVRTRLAMEAIAAAQNMAPSDEEVEQEFQRVSDDYKTPIEEVKRLINKKDIVGDLACRKALEFVMENGIAVAPVADAADEADAPKAAKTSKPKAEKEEKPVAEKKPRAKKTKDAE